MSLIPGSFPGGPREDVPGSDAAAASEVEPGNGNNPAAVEMNGAVAQPTGTMTEAATDADALSYAKPADTLGALLEEARQRAEARERRRRRMRHVAFEVAQTFVLAVLIFLLVRTVAQNFRVEGSSMEPGLHDGQYLLVNKAIYVKINLDTLGKYIPFVNGGDRAERYIFRAPKRGDVVVFRFPRDPQRDFIKRIIGVPGDVVEVVDGAVFVNGVLLEEPYAEPESRSDFERQVVPEAHYFVLGDNRSNSSDSRNWGFVPEANIIGQAMFTYWPLGDFGGVGNRSINLGFVRLPVPW